MDSHSIVTVKNLAGFNLYSSEYYIIHKGLLVEKCPYNALGYHYSQLTFAGI